MPSILGFSITASSVAATLVVLLVAYTVVGTISNYAKLRQFKGPPAAALGRLWLFWQEINGHTPQAQRAALRKYGSPTRIGSNLLITDDHELIRHMNAPGSRWTRSTWYEAIKWDPRQDNVFSTRDEKFHTEMRAKESPAYNGRENPGLESDIDTRIADMVNLIKTSYHGIPMDFAHVSRFFTLDVLSTIAFGRPFGFMAANKDLWAYHQKAAEFVTMLTLQTNHYSLYRFLSQSWVQALAAPKVTDKLGMGPALAFAKQAVSERFHPDAKQKKDMLGSFVERGLSQSQCECEAFVQVIAGSDSTTAVLRNAVFFITSTPTAYATLRAEIDAAVVEGITSSAPQYTHLLKLPYLKACIWEAIRLFPPLFGLKSKCAPVGGETFKGVFFPEGTEVGICDDAFMRREDIFGDDVDIFRPERFVEGDEQLRATRFRAAEVVFGSGRFTCLGRHIAMVELHKVLFELFRTFDFQIADPMKGVRIVRHSVHMVSAMELVARLR